MDKDGTRGTTTRCAVDGSRVVGVGLLCRYGKLLANQDIV